LTSKIKKIFSDTAIYTAGSVFNRLLPFLLLPVYTFYFNPYQYGTFSLVYAFWFFVSVFYLYGMESAFQKRFLEADSLLKKSDVYSSTVILILATSLIFSLLIFLFSHQIASLIIPSEPNDYLIKLVAFILIADALYRFPLILLNSLQKSKLYTLLNSLAVIVNVAANIIFIVYINFGIEAIFYSYLISYSFLFFSSFVFTLEYFKLKFNFHIVKSLLNNAHLFLYYGIFLMSIDLIDRFILEYYKGSDTVGIYSACYRIGIVMNLVITGFKVAWTPFFMNLKHDQNHKEIFSKIFSYFVYAGMIAFLLFSLLADDIVKISLFGYTLLNQQYWNGMVIVPYILLSYFLFGLTVNLNVAAFLKDKIHYLIISAALGCLSNIIFNLLLIPEYGIIGAAVSTMLSYLIMFIALYYFSQKTYYINYQWKHISGAVGLTFIFYGINLFIIPLIINNYFAVLSIKIFSIIILFYLLLGKQFNSFIKSGIIKFRLK
jgi:O-antigen/teichoic acid export membrane protein